MSGLQGMRFSNSYQGAAQGSAHAPTAMQRPGGKAYSDLHKSLMSQQKPGTRDPNPLPGISALPLPPPSPSSFLFLPLSLSHCACPHRLRFPETVRSLFLSHDAGAMLHNGVPPWQAEQTFPIHCLSSADNRLCAHSNTFILHLQKRHRPPFKGVHCAAR